MQPKMDELFLIYRRQHLLNERFSGGDVIDFIAYENHLKLATKSERRATKSITQFWGELLKRQPNMIKLRKHGLEISNFHTNILIKDGNFLVAVLNDKKTGQLILQRAEELDENEQSSMEEDSDPFSLAMFQNSGAVTISGNTESLGKILDVNPQYLNFFGFKKSDLVGQNISKIIPNPFSAPHDQTGFAKVIDRQRKVLMIQGNGYIMQIHLCVKQITSESGDIKFVGAVRPVEPTNELPEGFMIIDTSYQILHFSHECTAIFGIIPMKSSANSAQDSICHSLYDIIPDFEEKSSQYLSKAGCSMNLPTTGENTSINFTAESIEVAGFMYFIARIKVYKNIQPIEINSEKLSQCPFEKSEIEKELGNETMPMSFSPHNSQTDLSVSHSESSARIMHVKQNTRQQSISGKSDHSRSSSTSVSNPNQGSMYIRSLIAKKHKESRYLLNMLANGFLLALTVSSVCAIFEHMVFQSESANHATELIHLDHLGDMQFQVLALENRIRNFQLIQNYNISLLNDTLEKNYYIGHAILADIAEEWIYIATESFNALNNQIPLISYDNSELTLMEAFGIIVTFSQERLVRNNEKISDTEIKKFNYLTSSVLKNIRQLAMISSSNFKTIVDNSIEMDFFRASIAPIVIILISLLLSEEDSDEDDFDLAALVVANIDQDSEDVKYSDVSSNKTHQKTRSILTYFFRFSNDRHGGILSSHIQLINTIEYGLFYGNQSLGLLVSDAAVNNLNTNTGIIELGNLCSYDVTTQMIHYFEAVPMNQTSCNLFANGIMSKGLHELISWFTNQAYQISQLLLLPKDALLLESKKIIYLFELLLELDLHYSVRPLQAATIFYTSGVLSWNDQFDTAHLAATIIIIAFFVVFYVITIRAMIRSIADESHRTTMMLHMIPPEFLSKVKSIMVWAGDAPENIKETKNVENDPHNKKSEENNVRFASLRNLVNNRKESRREPVDEIKKE
ncbi:hypothetical protein HK096_000874 [Nowakowskiella sp. JEL0078]|nr:hypothetical protein HK096_000874 [Nowakowskiella sp. JEL0078]